jgi:hypothetical protein
MLRGTLLAESLRVGHDLRLQGLTVLRIGRHDVTESTVPDAQAPADVPSGASGSQPSVWTFVDFEAPDDHAEQLADAFADALLEEDGWYVDFRVGDDHVVVFAGKVFRYRVGDDAGRRGAVEFGLAAGTPPHQLDWPD